MKKYTPRPLRDTFNLLGSRFERWLSRVFPHYLPKCRKENWMGTPLSDNERSILDDLIILWIVRHSECALEI